MLDAAVVKSSFLSKLNSLSFDETSSDSDVKNAYAQMMAEWVIEAIQSATITIPSGTIITAGSATTQTQSAPAVVENGLS